MSTIESINEDQTTVSSIRDISNTLTPLSIFIIISFLCILWIIIYKSITSVFPTLSRLCTMIMFIIICLALLIILGQISYTLEWSCMIISSLLLLMGTYSILYPNVFFY